MTSRRVPCAVLPRSPGEWSFWATTHTPRYGCRGSPDSSAGSVGILPAVSTSCLKSNIGSIRRGSPRVSWLTLTLAPLLLLCACICLRLRLLVSE